MLILLADWAVDIYEALYEGGYSFSILVKTNRMHSEIKSLIQSSEVFTAAVESIMAIAVTMLVLYTLVEIMDQASSHMMTFAKLIKIFFLACVAVVFMYQIKLNFLDNKGIIAWIDKAVTQIGGIPIFGENYDKPYVHEMFQSSKEHFFSEENRIGLELGLKVSSGVIANLGYFLCAIIYWFFIFVDMIIVWYIGITRVAELTLRTLFAPIPLAGIAGSDRHTTAIRYLKRYAALVLQLFFMYIICYLFKQIMVYYTEAVGLTGDPKSVFNGLTSVKEATPFQCKQFIIEVLSFKNLMPRLAIMATKMGFELKSMQMCSELLGA